MIAKRLYEKGKETLAGGALLLLIPNLILAQTIRSFKDSVVVTSPSYRVVIQKKDGLVSYYFGDGSFLKNTMAMVKSPGGTTYTSDQFTQHVVEVQPVSDVMGKGRQLNIIHKKPGINCRLVQSVYFITSNLFLY